MEIHKKSPTEIEIKGNVKTFEDYQEIRAAIGDVVNEGHKELIIYLSESLSLTSSVIGYFIKTINVDRLSLTLYVKDDRLINLLDELKLLKMFNVKKIA